MKKRYILKGAHYAGRTITLGGFPFVKGSIVVDYTQNEHELFANFVRQWGAEEDDGQRIVQEDAQRQDQPPVQPEGEGTDAGDQAIDGDGIVEGEIDNDAGGLVPDGQGQAPGVDPELADEPLVTGEPELPEDLRVTKLREAVLALDPTDDSAWTKSGKPDLTAVELQLGYGGVTRAQVERALPGFKRPEVPTE